MMQMAGQFGRLSVSLINPMIAIPRCYTLKSLHSLSTLGRGTSSVRSCVLNIPRHTFTSRTKNCQIQGSFLLRFFHRLHHTSQNTCYHRQAHRLFSSPNLMRRTLHGSWNFVSPGLVRACSGSLLGCRWISSGQRKAWQHRNRSVMLYGVAVVILITGFSYAAVPLYTVFCQATGLGGQATQGHNVDLVEDMVPVRGRPISVRFNADTAASMQWNFRPQQREIKLVPGETALAFYSAVNPTDKPIIGISTYNVVPFDAGQYFNKIQCFCFEEQRLNPHEQVDMPVFFYIDPEFAEDPKMAKVDSITLSYTFFEAKEGLVLPDPFTRPAESKV